MCRGQGHIMTSITVCPEVFLLCFSAPHWLGFIVSCKSLLHGPTDLLGRMLFLVATYPVGLINQIKNLLLSPDLSLSLIWREKIKISQ